MNNLLTQITTFSSSFILKSARSIGVSNPYYSHLSTFNYYPYPWALKSLHLGSSSSSSSHTNNHNLLSRFTAVQCFSSKWKSPRKPKPAPETTMRDDQGKAEAEGEEYFVVRKGDIVGVYKTLSDCQAQVGSSISDPPVSVYKGYSLPKDAEEYLASRGLRNALYTIRASDLKDDLFGTLFACPFQEPVSTIGETPSTNLPQKRPHNMLESGNDNSCIIHFDGASKGNPGPAGAGVVLRTLNGSLICRIRQGLGIATNNVAEYRAVILGLKKALELGYRSVKAIGDSKLVCMQLQGLWKVRNQNMSDLYEEAKNLKDQLSSFQIAHVLRELNSDADAQANFGVCLADGQVEEVFH